MSLGGDRVNDYQKRMDELQAIREKAGRKADRYMTLCFVCIALVIILQAYKLLVRP